MPILVSDDNVLLCSRMSLVIQIVTQNT